MEVDHGVFQGFMAQYLLHMPDGHIGLQKVGGIGVPEDMGMDVFFNSNAFQSTLQRFLDTACTEKVASRTASTVFPRAAANTFVSFSAWIIRLVAICVSA